MITGWRTRSTARTASVIIGIVFAIGFLPCARPAPLSDDGDREYRVKAAFMYQFLLYVDGLKFQREPDKDGAEELDGDKRILIGIIGKNPFKEALAPLRKKQVYGRKLSFLFFEGPSSFKKGESKDAVKLDMDSLSRCDLLFISSSEKSFVGRILAPLRTKRILTISDMPGFVDRGGMIGLLTDGDKVRFEINLKSAIDANLKFSSTLLRLAYRIIH